MTLPLADLAAILPELIVVAAACLVPDGHDRHYDAWHPFWDLTPLAWSPTRLHGGSPSNQARVVRYPVCALRYWFMYHLIHKEFLARQRPLSFCEVGVGTGQMLSFMRTGETPGECGPLPAFIETWDAMSHRVDDARLAAIGYSRCFSHNVEDPDLVLPRQYDVLILLHILEHLHDPEKVFAKLLPFVREGGLIIGGFPGLPHVMCRSRERRLRQSAESFGHVSAFSPRRVRMLAKRNALSLELLTGAYLFRKNGFILEHHGWWTRLNLLFGALFPGWPGELYWAMRKPAASHARPEARATRHAPLVTETGERMANERATRT